MRPREEDQMRSAIERTISKAFWWGVALGFIAGWISAAVAFLR